MCLEIGFPCVHPRHLIKYLSSKDIADWMAYYVIEPFGAMHNEEIGGTISATIANSHRGKDQAAFTETDFMLHYVAPEMTSTEMKDNYYAWIGQSNADR